MGRDKTYTYEAGNDSFTFYIDFSITTDYGSDELEIQVDIVSLLSPKILLAVPEEGYIVPVGVDLELKPEVINSENTEYTWTVYGEKKSDQKDFIFNSSKIGMYEVVLIAKNADGEGVLKFNVKVCTSEEMPFEWMWETETFNLTIGRTAFIRSYWIKNAFDATYSWQVDGSDEIVQTGHECLFAYKPETQGTHPVTVTMKNQYIERKKTFTVNVYPPVQPRPITATSKATADHGYFFLLAPAQHVNRGNSETVIPLRTKRRSMLSSTTIPVQPNSASLVFGADI
ncbi:MAG: PKD-like domain-containing protein [Odoribacter splanchnicus]